MPIAKGILERYRILGEPARFPLGEIHTGFDPFADRAVTVYEVASGAANFRPTSLVEDVRDSSRITHPNLLPALMDMVSQTGPSYLVTCAAKGARLDQLGGDKGLTAQGALHIVRVLANLLVYCWKSGIRGCGFGPRSIFVAPEGIRITSVAESRLLARAEGRALDGQASDVAGFADVVACALGHCRRAGGSGETLEAIPDVLNALGFEPARQIINGPAAEDGGDGSATRLRLDAGDFLFKEGDASDDTFYVLETGLVQVIKADPLDNEVFLDFSRPGQLIGEMAVIDKLPRMATIRAVEPSRLLVIRGGAFRTKLEKLDKVALMLIETLSGRLRQRADEVASLKAALGGNR